MSSTPIADLSYRNYDGPLEAPGMRWWVISKMSMRLAIKKKGFWVWATLSAYWYFLLGAVFYFMDALGSQLPGAGQSGKNPLLSQIIWRDQFLNSFNISQLLLFILALLIGVGTIANDNRANALLVYLSKPCTKADYLIGKWVGIFLPLTAITAGPTLVFYAYCAMSYQQYGFGNDHWLLLKLMTMCLLPGIFHASVCLGISSLFNQGRLAGATYAGIYFISLTFTATMAVTYAVNAAQIRRGHQALDVPGTITTLYYCSVDGIQQAIAKNILGTNGSPLFPTPNSSQIPAPSLGLFLTLYIGICAVSLLIAWTRVRAVEVIRG